MKILITGGSGLIGRRLTEILQEAGHEVRHLSRKPGLERGVEVYQWSVDQKTIDLDAVKEIDAVVHLAGVSVADKRWNDAEKQRIMDSRVNSAALIGEALQKENVKPKVILSASGVGYYGVDTKERVMCEDDNKGDGFLADVVQEWEASADRLSVLCDRVVKLRIGVVLSKKGGALDKMSQPIKYGAGAPLGTGEQYMSWIHIDDLCKMMLWSIDNASVHGTYNAVAPEPVTNKELTKQIAKTLKRPLILPNVPAFVLKMMLGEMSTIVLGGNKVASTKVESAGFPFMYSSVESALHQIYNNN